MVQLVYKLNLLVFNSGEHFNSLNDGKGLVIDYEGRRFSPVLSFNANQPRHV
jgi:hypothetical protein